MSFIDKHGKIFGKINLIDFITLFVVFCVLGALYPALIRLTRLESPFTSQQSPSTSAAVKITPSALPVKNHNEIRSKRPLVLTVRFSGYSAEVASAVRAGDKDVAEGGTQVTEVVSVEPMLRANEHGVTYLDPHLKSIVVKIATPVIIESTGFLYRNMPIKLGAGFLLKTVKYDMNGEVIRIEDTVFEISKKYQIPVRRTLDLNIRFSGYSNEVAQAVKVGDQDMEEAGTRILKIVSIEPMLGTNAQGARYRDPYLKSIVVKLRATAVFDGECYAYRNEPLKLGWHFLLKTSTYDMNGEVIKIDTGKDS